MEKTRHKLMGESGQTLNDNGYTQPQALRDLARSVHELLDAAYPAKLGFLNYRNPFELIISVILSAQTTDRQVNGVTGALFFAYPTPADLARADIQDVERLIHSTGFYRAKAKNIMGAAETIHTQYHDTVPGTMEELLQIPGVGRKSASVILGAVFNKPAIIVDTHFARVVRRLGLTDSHQPEKIEQEIAALLMPGQQYRFSMTVNNHGRIICHARKPECVTCLLHCSCPKIGVKAAVTGGESLSR
jgi:endonuclease III